MKTPHLFIVACAIAFVVSVVPNVHAQDDPPPPLDVGISFAYMHENYLQTNLTTGWVLSVQRHVNDHFVLVGEGNGNYWHTHAFPQFIPYSVWVHSIQAGPRLQAHASDRLTVFGQVLAGWVRRSRTNPGSIIVPENQGDINTLGFQPGGGVDVRINRKVAVRLEGDYRFLKSTDVVPQSNQSRVLVGFVFGVERKP
jgi:opacity protein-like surface antigen